MQCHSNSSFFSGSGKTLSYAVPMIQSLRSRDKRISRTDGVYAVILVPTRELALQSLAVIKKLVQVCDDDFIGSVQPADVVL